MIGSFGFIISRSKTVAKDPRDNENSTVVSKDSKSEQWIAACLKPPSLLTSCISFMKKSLGEISSCFKYWRSGNQTLSSCNRNTLQKARPNVDLVLVHIFRWFHLDQNIHHLKRRKTYPLHPKRPNSEIG